MTLQHIGTKLNCNRGLTEKIGIIGIYLSRCKLIIIIAIDVPDTSSNPDERTFNITALLPLNRPARRITTVPGVMEDLILGGFRTGVGPFFTTTSSAG
jgi:hypothetical protein